MDNHLPLSIIFLYCLSVLSDHLPVTTISRCQSFPDHMLLPTIYFCQPLFFTATMYHRRPFTVVNHFPLLFICPFRPFTCDNHFPVSIISRPYALANQLLLSTIYICRPHIHAIHLFWRLSAFTYQLSVIHVYRFRPLHFPHTKLVPIRHAWF